MLSAVDSYVVGTAGHIDHGKSALVKALTGTDPDRLEEEKRRGMTIDLGFAFMDLASGRHVGIVDVPGHQRFLKNMLAGVHGIDAVLLVIAADEGPMPQTHEHLAILALDRRVRVRGLQQHNRPVERAHPGSRTAVNLAGVERGDVPRGAVLAGAGGMVLSRRIDARVRVLEAAPRPIRHRTRLLLYQGTAEVAAEVLLLDGDRLEPGAEGYLQLYVEGAVPALTGDRFILRQPSPAATVAGGVMLDVSPRRHRRGDPAVLTGLRSRGRLDPQAMLAQELGQHRLGVSVQALARRLS